MDFGDVDTESGDDCTELKGRHTEADCRLYRDEMARREAHCAALGVATELRLLRQAERPPQLAEPERVALPTRIPESRRLPAPADD